VALADNGARRCCRSVRGVSPFLSPHRVKASGQFVPADGWVGDSPSHWLLTDGGVYDNLGLQTLDRFGTVLVSDGGFSLKRQADPSAMWSRQVRRIVTIMDQQVRSLRRRKIVGELESGARQGAYWGINTDIDNYPVADPIRTNRKVDPAEVPTRLKKLSKEAIEAVVESGYTLCDSALRSHAPELMGPNRNQSPKGLDV